MLKKCVRISMRKTQEFFLIKVNEINLRIKKERYISMRKRQVLRIDMRVKRKIS